MAETVARVTIETGGEARCIAFAMSESDVDYMLSQNEFAIGSDGSSLPLSESENDGKPHPRNFGTFPRFLRMARERNLCSPEVAVHRITGLPAKMMGFNDRGILKVGSVADITVFDYANVTDRATYDNPFQRPEGIHHVFMAGKPAIQNGVQTAARLGEFLLKNRD
jgi:N-acyl-D-amino-acid deacylase